MFFTDNTNYVNESTREQAPIVSLQGHLIRTIRPGFWVAADGNYWKGGRTTTNGVAAGLEQKNSRLGVTLAVPYRRQQVRVSYSFGAYTTVGGDLPLGRDVVFLRLGRTAVTGTQLPISNSQLRPVVQGPCPQSDPGRGTAQRMDQAPKAKDKGRRWALGVGRSAHALTLPRRFERHTEVPGDALVRFTPRDVEPDDIHEWHQDTETKSIAVEDR